MVSPELFAKADARTLEEILREAEAYLNAQLTASIASDQRGLAFASLLGAGVIVIAGSGASLILEKSAIGLGWTCVGISVGLLMAMILAVLSAMPGWFWFVGNTPSAWAEDITAGKTYETSIAEQLSYYSEQIAENGTLMLRNSLQMKWSILIAWITLVEGGAFAIGMLID